MPMLHRSSKTGTRFGGLGLPRPLAVGGSGTTGQWAKALLRVNFLDRANDVMAE